MWKEFNVNPMSRRVGDCAVRAIARVMERDWEKIFIEICLYGFMMCNMPSANEVWGAFLRAHGFKRAMVKEDCPDCYSVRDFCSEHPRGKYVLALHEHVVAVVDGDYYDTWDSGDKTPLYYWYKEDDA